MMNSRARSRPNRGRISSRNFLPTWYSRSGSCFGPTTSLAANTAPHHTTSRACTLTPASHSREKVAGAPTSAVNTSSCVGDRQSDDLRSEHDRAVMYRKLYHEATYPRRSLMRSSSGPAVSQRPEHEPNVQPIA